MSLKPCKFDETKKDFLVKQGLLTQILECSPKTLTNYINKGMPYVQIGQQKSFYVNMCKDWYNKNIAKVKEPIKENKKLVTQISQSLEEDLKEFSFLDKKEFKQFSNIYQKLQMDYTSASYLHKHLLKDLTMLLLQKEKIYQNMSNVSEELIRKKIEDLKEDISKKEKYIKNNILRIEDKNHDLNSAYDGNEEYHIKKDIEKNELLIKEFESAIKEDKKKIEIYELKLIELENKTNLDSLEVNKTYTSNLNTLTTQIEKTVKIIKGL